MCSPIRSVLKYKVIFFSIIIIFSIGTGKSIVGAHIAYAFAIGNRKVSSELCVLYCGPSNKAVDVVHGKSSDA